MNKAVGIILLVTGAILVAISAVGLFNSDLDSRELLLTVFGAAGIVVMPIGYRQMDLAPGKNP